jgi:hypothetical protein
MEAGQEHVYENNLSIAADACVALNATESFVSHY